MGNSVVENSSVVRTSACRAQATAGMRKPVMHANVVIEQPMNPPNTENSVSVAQQKLFSCTTASTYNHEEQLAANNAKQKAGIPTSAERSTSTEPNRSVVLTVPRIKNQNPCPTVAKTEPGNAAGTHKQRGTAAVREPHVSQTSLSMNAICRMHVQQR